MTREQFREPLLDVLRSPEPDWLAPRRDEAALLYDAAPGAQRVVVFSGLDTGERSAIATALALRGMRPPPAMAVAQERHATRPLSDLLSKAVRRRLREVASTDEKRVHLAAEAAREAADRARAQAQAAAEQWRAEARAAGEVPEGEKDAEAALADANAAANAAARAAAKAAKAARVPFTGWPTVEEREAQRAKARAAAASEEPDSDDEDDGSEFDKQQRELPYKRAAEAARLAQEKEARDAAWRQANGIVEDYGVPREPEPWELPDYDPDDEGQSEPEGVLVRGRDGMPPEADGPALSPEMAADEAKARGFMEELERSREAGADLSFLRAARDAMDPDATTAGAPAEPAWFKALKAKYDMPAVWDRLRDAQLPIRDPGEEAAAGVRRAAAASAAKAKKGPETRIGKLNGYDDVDLLGADLRDMDGGGEISIETAIAENRAAREAVRQQILAAEAAKRPAQAQRTSYGPEPPSSAAR